MGLVWSFIFSRCGGLLVVALFCDFCFSVVHMQHVIQMASVLTICGGILPLLLMMAEYVYIFLNMFLQICQGSFNFAVSAAPCYKLILMSKHAAASGLQW